MKKILTTFLFAIVLSLGFSAPTFAASFGVAMSGTDVFENSTTITVSVTNFDGVNGYCGGLCAIVMTLDYDSSKVAVTPSALNGFTLTAGPRLVLDRATGVPAGTAILSLKISNVGLAVGESTTISLTGISGSDSDVNATAASTSKTISLKASDPTPAPTPTPNNINTTTGPSSNTSADRPSDASKKENDSEEETQSEDTDETDTDKTSESDSSKSKSNKNRKKLVTISTDNDGQEPEKSPDLLIWGILIIVTLLALIGLLIYLFILRKRRQKQAIDIE